MHKVERRASRAWPWRLGPSLECVGHRRRVPMSRGSEHPVSVAATRRPQPGSVPARGTRRPRPHGSRCARTICNLALSGASKHAPEASRVSIAHLRRDPCWHSDRGSSGAGRGQAPTRSRPWTLRAILTDPNGLWWRPRVRRAARLPGRGLKPQARNLRVRSVAKLACGPRANSRDNSAALTVERRVGAVVAASRFSPC